MDHRKQLHTPFARPLVNKTQRPPAPPPDREAVRRAFDTIVRRRGGGTLDRSLTTLPAGDRSQRTAARLLDPEAVRRALDHAVRRGVQRGTSGDNAGPGDNRGAEGHQRASARPGATPARRRPRQPKGAAE